MTPNGNNHTDVTERYPVACPRCHAPAKNDGTHRINYEVFECGTELFEGTLTGPCERAHDGEVTNA